MSWPVALSVMVIALGLLAGLRGAWFRFRLWRARRTWRRLSRQMVRESIRRAKERGDARALVGDSLIDALKLLGKTGRR